MNCKEIISSEPGTRHLVSCPQADLEAMVGELCAGAADMLKERTTLNRCPVLSMDVSSLGERANEFHDLSRLQARLIVCAGRRSRFEGLLLLNVAQLLSGAENAARLRALGEILALRDGLASRCITVVYGPANEQALLRCANLLDFDGGLCVTEYAVNRERTDAAALLRRVSLRCDTAATQKTIQAILTEMADEADFDPEKFLSGCSAGGGVITGNALKARLQDPYSYVNRFRRTKAEPAGEERRIGFQMSR